MADPEVNCPRHDSDLNKENAELESPHPLEGGVPPKQRQASLVRDSQAQHVAR